MPAHPDSPYRGMGRQGWRDLVQFAQRGVVELQNACFTDSPYPVALVTSAAQIGRDYDRAVADARDRPEPAREQPRERPSELEN